MHFSSVFRHLPKPRRHYRHQSHRTYLDESTINWVRDRALDHAVEKERDLRPMLNLKNLIISEPSKSLPVSFISQHKHSLSIPTRPIEFLRKYPAVFQEFLPGGIGINPHVKLTPEVLTLDVEEQVLYQTQIHKQDVADRLLKLLMIGRINKIPLHVIDMLKWDLGLPNDYVKSIVPEFPDYFRVMDGVFEPYLELVCWSNELAVSMMEKKAMVGGKGYEKGMPLAFDLQYSRGFEIDKKFKKWVDEWQKLPYISPYENALHLQAKSDESDKWAVSLLHEILNLLVPKKTERDNLLCLGEYLGVRSRFKRALLQHPGIFYISSKIRTHTVVLRDAYKRDLLLGKHHPLMGLRSNYIHLMYTVKDEKKSKKLQGEGARKEKMTADSWEGEGEVDDNGGVEEEDEESSSYSDSEDANEDDEEDDQEEEEGNKTRNVSGRATSDRRIEGRSPLKKDISAIRGRRRSRDDDNDDGDDDEHEKVIISGKKHDKTRNNRGRVTSDGRIEGTSPLKQKMSAKSVGRRSREDDYDDEHGQVIISGKRNREKQFDDRPTRRHTQNSSIGRKFGNFEVDDTDDENEVLNNDAVSRGRTIQTKFDEKTPLRMDQRLDRKGGSREKSPPRFRRTDRSAGQSTESSRGFSRARGRTYTDKSSSI